MARLRAAAADTAANDVAIHSDGRLFVSNYAPSTRDVACAHVALRRSARRADWRCHGVVAEGRLAPLAEHGRRDAERHRHRRGRKRLFVAELGKQRVVEFELGRDGSATQRAEFPFRDLADDLNWTMRGTLLVGGQVRKDPKQWSVAEIDPKAGTVRSLFEQRSEIHSVTSATDVGDGIVFGSAGDQQIAIARW